MRDPHVVYRAEFRARSLVVCTCGHRDRADSPEEVAELFNLHRRKVLPYHTSCKECGGGVSHHSRTGLCARCAGTGRPILEGVA